MHRFKNQTPDDPINSVDVRQASLVRIRVQKEDSAFVYAVFEAHDGTLAYSTLSHQPGDRFRDLELIIPHGMKAEAQRILEDLKKELKGNLYVEGLDYTP